MTTVATAPDLRAFLEHATWASGIDACGYPLLLLAGEPARTPGDPVPLDDICYPVRILWAADGPTATPPTEDQP
jgi:hypothetical protein